MALTEAIPAGIRREPAAELRRQYAQRRRHILRSAGAGIIQRTAAKRRISSTENHRAVDRIGIVDDSFAQAGDADVRHRQDQPVDHFRGWLCGRRRTRRLVGLAVLPNVKTLAGLAAEFTLGDLVT